MDGGKTTITKREVPAVTRAVAILRRLGRSDEPMGVNQLARELKLVPSTVLHILRVLQDEGLVSFDPETKRYAIGLGILAIARSAIQRNNFPALIQPHLTELSERFAVTCIATEMVGPSHMIVVALSQSSLPFRLQVDLGSRFPALISATGRCFAAFNIPDPASLEPDFQRLTWDQPPGFETWLAEVAQTRQRGYAVDPGTYISGVTVVAVPFFDAQQRMNRSLVAIGISDRVEAAGLPALTEALIETRDQVANLQIMTKGVSR